MTITVHTSSVLSHFFRRIVSEKNSQVSVRKWSDRGGWIPANPSLPSFLKDQICIRRKLIGFGFSGLFDFLFLSCPNKFLYGEFVIFSDFPP
jgi:hypothetical protein